MRSARYSFRSRRITGLLLALFLVFLSFGYFRRLVGINQPPSSPLSSTPSIRRRPEKNCPTPEITFKCPDGRLGLHIVHTRFLITQAKANLLFQATRLQLLHTFLVPSLRFQTKKSFVIYASYDPGLSKSLVTALEDALKLTDAFVILNPESDTAMDLNFSQLSEQLQSRDRYVKDVDLFINSRIDVDDTTHVGSVEAIQDYACDGPAGAVEGAAAAGSARKQQGKEPHVRLAYIQGGQLWFPSDDPKRPYGSIGVWKTWKERVYDDIYKFLAIMQSMIISGREFIDKCQALNVYSYPHYLPEALANLTLPGCPKFEFKPDKKKTNRYMMLWDPPEGHIGNFYVRTMSSWSHEKIDLHYHLRAANISAIQQSFSISPGELAGVNMLFAGFEERKAGLLLNNSDIPIEK